MAERGTGVTTRLIVEHVAHILDNPGTWVLCTDHYDSLKADVDLCRSVLGVLEALHVPYESRGYSILVPKIQHKEYPSS